MMMPCKLFAFQSTFMKYKTVLMASYFKHVNEIRISEVFAYLFVFSVNLDVNVFVSS